MKYYSNLGICLLTAAFTSFSTASLGDNRLVINGEQYKPPYKECKKALVNGTLIPSGTQDNRVTVFYEDRGYVIAMARVFICVAWKYK